MKRIPDKSIDLILCDLPYENTQNKWDLMIDPDKLWKQYKRVIKDKGAIILFGQGKFAAKMMLSQPKLHRYNLIWEKTRPSGFLNARRMPLRSHEDIMVFYKKLPTYNPQMTEGEPYYKKQVSDGLTDSYGDYSRKGFENVNKGERFPRSVIRFSNDNHNSLHPTQKPVDLFEWLIKTYTNENETVLDNCMGSGTTAIACINTNRSYIGFELEKEYYDLANKRIVEHKESLLMDK